MKIIKTASGKKTIKMSKSEWQSIGKTAGWVEAMGDPRTDYAKPIDGVIQELMSALSSLNMEPTPIAPENEGGFYLSETDEYAKHAYDHISAALKLVTKLQNSENSNSSVTEISEPPSEELAEWRKNHRMDA